MDNKQLPEELAKEIANKAKEYSQLFKHGEAYREPAFIDGATAYVTELHEVNLKYGVLKTAYDNDQNKLELLHSSLKEANERERVLVEALREISSMYPLGYFTGTIARKALAQYEGKKEAGDEA